MRRPPTVSPLESAQEAETRSIQGGGDPRGALDGRREPTDKRSNDAPSNVIGPGKPGSRRAARGDANADPRSARPEVAVHVSVIDGADRLVYVDVRDRRGWKQPLAAEQVESELRHLPSATNGVTSAEPRTVRTLEMGRPLAPQPIPASKTPTPYSVGKASISASPSPSAQHQRMSAPPRAPTLPTQATHQAPARAR